MNVDIIDSPSNSKIKLIDDTAKSWLKIVLFYKNKMISKIIVHFVEIPQFKTAYISIFGYYL